MINFFKKYIKKKHLGYSYTIRNNKTDIQTSKDVFDHKYHRPDILIEKKNPVIFDLGSNIGLSIIDLKFLYPDSLIIGVEMDKDNFNLANQNCGELKDIKLYNNAIWINENQLNYDKGVANDAYSVKLDSNNRMDEGFTNGITISKLIQLNSIKEIDYLKMDIEGAEDSIFEANIDWLEYVRYTKIEVHNGEKSMDFIFKRLIESGFMVKKDTNHWSTLIGIKN